MTYSLSMLLWVKVCLLIGAAWAVGAVVMASASYFDSPAAGVASVAILGTGLTMGGIMLVVAVEHEKRRIEEEREEEHLRLLEEAKEP
jgi:hypothetical protein